MTGEAACRDGKARGIFLKNLQEIYIRPREKPVLLAKKKAARRENGTNQSPFFLKYILPIL